MGERKVINKYIPADFDPALVPRGTKLSKKDGTVPVRMMLPFSIQCDTCRTFMYRGRKFNSKKEAMGGPQGRYLGIQRWRFYIKCTHCSRTVTFLTDPKNADYEMESGASRNYEVYKDKANTEQLSALEQEELEKEDKMKALENRILDSQREMADLDNLEEIKAMNRRHVQLLSSSNRKSNEGGEGFGADAKALLLARDAKQKRQEEAANDVHLNEHGITEEEEALVQSIQFGSQEQKIVTETMVRRLDDEDERRLEAQRKEELERVEHRRQEMFSKKKAPGSTTFLKAAPIVKVKRKRTIQSNSSPVEADVAGGNENDGNPKRSRPEATMSASSTGDSGSGLAALLDYGSDSD